MARQKRAAFLRKKLTDSFSETCYSIPMQLTKTLTIFTKTVTYPFLPISAHPLLGFTLALIAGILWQASESSLLTTIGPLAVFLLCALTVRNKRITALCTFSWCMFFLGALLFSNQVAQQNIFYQEFSQETIAAEGEVRAVEEIDNPRFTHVITLEMQQCATSPNPAWRARNATLQLYVAQKKLVQQLPKVGDILRVEDLKIKRPSNKDFLTYLNQRKNQRNIVSRNSTHTDGCAPSAQHFTLVF